REAACGGWVEDGPVSFDLAVLAMDERADAAAARAMFERCDTSASHAKVSRMSGCGLLSAVALAVPRRRAPCRGVAVDHEAVGDRHRSRDHASERVAGKSRGGDSDHGTRCGVPPGRLGSAVPGCVSAGDVNAWSFCLTQAAVARATTRRSRSS